MKSMDDTQYEKFLNRLRKNLRCKFDTEIKPSELRIQVDKFINHETDKISIRYLESYLLTLNDMAVDGGLKAILRGKMNVSHTWRDLLILSTEDQPLPKDINVDQLEAVIIKEIKSLFTNALKYCANENKEVFHSNIQTVNKFLTIRKGSD